MTLEQEAPKKSGIFYWSTLAVFLIVLGGSWYFLTPNKNWSSEEKLHNELQYKFQEILSDFVQKKVPRIEQIVFHKVWTKKIKNSNNVKIIFDYSTWTGGDASGKTKVQGEAELRPVSQDVWEVTSVDLTDETVSFDKPLIIRPTAKKIPTYEKDGIPDMQEEIKQEVEKALSDIEKEENEQAVLNVEEGEEEENMEAQESKTEGAEQTSPNPAQETQTSKEPSVEETGTTPPSEAVPTEPVATQPEEAPAKATPEPVETPPTEVATPKAVETPANKSPSKPEEAPGTPTTQETPKPEETSEEGKVPEASPAENQ